MNPSDLQAAIRISDVTATTLFSSLNIVSRFVLQHGATDKHALDAIIRLRELAESDTIDLTVKDAIYSLCREAGLFPYLQREKLSWRDQIAFEFFRGPPKTNYVF